MNSIIRVTAAILVRGGRLFIAQRKHGDRLAGKWEFPGGKIEPGETPEACLRRELLEELGIDAAIGEYLGANVHHYEHLSIELLAFRARWVGGDLRLNDHKALRWVSVDELRQFEFSPADVPFVDQLVRGEIDL